MANYLLDTHIWVWFHVQPERLSKKVLEILSERQYNNLYLSAISSWEVCKLEEKGRLRFSVPAIKWVNKALQIPGLRVVGLAPEIACGACSLPGKFHGDPADQIIVATTRETGATIITADKKILDYPYVKTIQGKKRG